jgi:hypothetical protein
LSARDVNGSRIHSSNSFVVQKRGRPAKAVVSSVRRFRASSEPEATAWRASVVQQRPDRRGDVGVALLTECAFGISEYDRGAGGGAGLGLE